MLIKAMMTRIDRENMIEFKGMGVPIVVTCDTSVTCGLPAVSGKCTNFTEPRREWQSLVSSKRPSLTGSSGKCVERSANAENEWDR